MQEYVNQRAKAKISPVTIRKEVATLRAAWNWGEPMELTLGRFPSQGLRYPKADEKPPFMTMAEIERQIAAGGDPDTLWEALYLQASELTELLALVKVKAPHPWIYPLFCFAAHTGARRSEILRGLVALDLRAMSLSSRSRGGTCAAGAHWRACLLELLERHRRNRRVGSPAGLGVLWLSWKMGCDSASASREL